LYPYPEPFTDPEFVRSGTEKPGKRENLFYICENKDEKEKNRHSFLPVVDIPFFLNRSRGISFETREV
jgi:hypothetical protein